MKLLIMSLFLFLSCTSTIKEGGTENKLVEEIPKKEVVKELADNKVIEEMPDTKTVLDSLVNRLPNFKLPLSSNKIKTFLKKDKGRLCPDDQKLSNKIMESPNHLFNHVKSEHEVDEYFYEIENRTYYPLFKKIEKEYITIGSIVSVLIEEYEIPGVFFVLTNFDKNGNQIDYLIVFNRFNYESVYKYDFVVDKKNTITIDRLFEDYYDDVNGGFIDDDGDDEPATEKIHQKYKINKSGIFELITSSRDYTPAKITAKKPPENEKQK